MRKYKSIIFDLDGTLLDTIQDITNSINSTLVKYNFNIRYTTDDVTASDYNARAFACPVLEQAY